MKKNSAFTLIETLIYAGIVSGFVTVSIIMVYQMIEFRDSLDQKRALDESQRFLVQKINWVLNSVDVINSPAAGATSSSISVNKISYASNPLVVSQSGGTVLLSIGGSAPVAISNNYASTTNLVFENLSLYGKSVVRVTATLKNNNATTSIDSQILIE